jgi:hypothetical protein
VQSTSLADARYAEGSGDVASLESQKLKTSEPSGLEAEQEKNPEPEEVCFPTDWSLDKKIEWCGKENVHRAADIWYQHTGLGDAANHRDLICDLIYLHGENFLAYMPIALKDCPKTAGVKWRDFPYFARNWEKTMGNVRAWERQKQAKLHERADLSRHGACQQCSIAPAARSTGLCSPCEKKFIRAQNLLDDSDNLRKHHLIWMVGDSDKRYIGTEEEQLFAYLKDEDFKTKCKRLAEQPTVMDRMDALYRELGVFSGHGFDIEEA